MKQIGVYFYNCAKRRDSRLLKITECERNRGHDNNTF